MSRDSAAGTVQRTLVPVGSPIVLIVSKGMAPASSADATVPDVVGEAQADALTALQQVGMNAQIFTQANETYARGKVIAQWPRSRELAAPGTTAALMVSSGAPAEGTSLMGVPNVVGQTEAAAQATLEQSRLSHSVLAAFSPTVPTGVVMAQVPEERSVVPAPKSKLWLWLMAALAVLLIAVAAMFFFNQPPATDEVVVVPDVVGMVQADAEAALTEIGLTAGRITESQSTTAAAGSVMSQDPAKDAEVAKGSRVNLVVAVKSDLVEVPNVVGSTRDSALQTLGRAELKVSTTEAASDSVAKGTVISQSPKAGQQVPADTEVGIVVSTGAKQTNVSVPNVVGMSSADAKAEIADNGLKAKAVESYSASVPKGDVIGQSPSAGASVAAGTQIMVLVSAGPVPSGGDTVSVPDVVGMSVADATAELTAAGLKLVSYKTDGTGAPADEVVYQTPLASEDAPKNSQVVLVVSSGK
ncbi:MAG: PASTA domain-containing protein [Coriobacteriia bacterium]|nr:PASTA domain-containing protein [Coriobacteriia bacterium]